MVKIVITANHFSSVDDTIKLRLKEAGFIVKEYNDVTNYSFDKLVSILKDADGIIAGLEVYDRALLAQLPKLNIIARRGVGTDNIDMDAAKDFGIKITITDGLVGDSVGELVMAYMLDHSRKLSLHTSFMKEGQWNRILSEGLRGKTLGLIGFGSIGKSVAQLAVPFGMNVLCYYRNRDIDLENKYQVTYCDMNTLLFTSDYVSLHVPLTKETTHMLNVDTFHKMKPSAVVINTSRSKVIKTKDLVYSLQSNLIDAVYLDVFDQEPTSDLELLRCAKGSFTPHIGTFTKSTFQSMNYRCANQIMHYFHQY